MSASGAPHIMSSTAVYASPRTETDFSPAKEAKSKQESWGGGRFNSEWGVWEALPIR